MPGCGRTCGHAHPLQTVPGYICEGLQPSCRLCQWDSVISTGTTQHPRLMSDFLQPSGVVNKMSSCKPLLQPQTWFTTLGNSPWGSGSNPHFKGDKIATGEVEIAPVPDSCLQVTVAEQGRGHRWLLHNCNSAAVINHNVDI